MIKRISNLNNVKKDKKISFTKNPMNNKTNNKSNQLIISGIVISLASILLLLYTINNKFG